RGHTDNVVFPNNNISPYPRRTTAPHESRLLITLGTSMNFLQPAQAGAQLLSLIVFATMAVWYVAPRTKTRGRADALTPLLWPHVFRYIALQALSAQKAGFPISDGGLMEIIVGDVAGAVIAFAAIVALRLRAPLAIALAWLLVAET